MKMIEFIESYRIPDDGGDYQWNDNHGRLIRCKDCKHHDGSRCFRWNSTIITGFDDYCSKAELREEE